MIDVKDLIMKEYLYFQFSVIKIFYLNTGFREHDRLKHLFYS